MNKEKRKEWRLANPEKHRSEQRLYYARHKEKVCLRVRTTRPLYSRVYGPVYRTRKTQAGGTFTIEEWFTLCFAVGFRCLCCGENKPLEADHIIPVSKGGTSWLWNIQPLCGDCNKKKRSKIIDYRV
jgi:5-methylcytosine-specific restriction endonuclease McrA